VTRRVVTKVTTTAKTVLKVKRSGVAKVIRMSMTFLKMKERKMRMTIMTR
jgi:hypothetical protein